MNFPEICHFLDKLRRSSDIKSNSLKLRNIKDYNFKVSESCDQCQRYSGIFIYAFLALTKPYNYFTEIRHFVNNSERSS